MGRARRPRQRALAVVLATLLVPLVVGSAAASKPTVVVTPTVTGDDVAVAVSVNRGTHQIASCEYGVDATPTIDCTNRVGVGKKSTSYTINLANQATGSHTITVTVQLTDGGNGTGSAPFTIAPPRVFVTAFSDLDGNHTYQAGTDSLIAKLVDTDRSNTVSVGDTVVADRFPLDFAATTFADATVTSHAVTAATFVASDAIQVEFGGGLGAGGGLFIWQTGTVLTNGTVSERYFESGPTGVTSLNDVVSGTCSPGDTLLVRTGSPSQPSAGAGPAIACDGANSIYVEIMFS